MRRLYSKAKNAYERYERHITTAALVVGFVVDNLTLRRVDLLAENLLIMGYIAAAAACVALLNLYPAGRIRWRFYEKVHVWVPTLLQLVFGGLFSGFVVFYSRSGAWLANWPFLLVLAALLVGNELFRSRYLRQTFQMSVLFLALFLFLIFYVPVALGSMGPLVFLLSGLLSLALMLAFAITLLRATGDRLKAGLRSTVLSVAGIYAAMNLLYFTNAIPPIPLSFKDGGIYRSVERSPEGGYAAVALRGGEACLLCLTDVIRAVPGEPVYAYSAVFAPTKLSTTIVHDWQRWSDTEGRWVSSGRIRFPIAGGRDGGYRGYSMKSNVAPGLWRVDVETEQGQVIGRMKFRIEPETAPPAPAGLPLIRL